MKILALCLALLPLFAACAPTSTSGKPASPAGEIEIAAELENLTVTPREGDLVTILFHVNNNTRNPLILRDLTQPFDLMLSGSSGAVMSWQYAQPGMLTYQAERDEWIYDKSRRSDVKRPIFNSGLLVPQESLSFRARVRLLEVPMDFQFTYFELTNEELRRKVYFEKREDKILRYRPLVGRELDDALTPSLKSESGGHRFVVFPHAEPLASNALLKTFRFQTTLKPRLFSLERASQMVGIAKPHLGDYTYSTLFDGWILPKKPGYVLATPSGATELPEMRNVERTFYLLDTIGTGRVEIELRAHSAATTLSELRYPLVKQEREIPVSKDVKEKRTYYYLFLNAEQLPKFLADLRTLKLVLDVEYGEGGGRLQVLNR